MIIKIVFQNWPEVRKLKIIRKFFKIIYPIYLFRNTVPVPRHWCAKRKYLQGKRGFEKPAFDLPDFIKRTGIQGMREAVNEKVIVLGAILRKKTISSEIRNLREL